MKQLLSHWSYSTRMSKKNKLHSMILGPLLGLFHLQSGLLGHKNLMVVVSASAADLVSGGHHDEQLHDKNEDLLVPTTTATATSMLPTPVDDDDDFVNAEDDDESDWDFESCMENERLTRAKFDADRRLPGTEKDVVPSAMLQRKLLPEDTSTAGVLAGAAWNNTSASDEDPSALLQLTERERNEIENKKKKKDCCGPDEKDYSESVEAGKGNACGKCCGKANGKNWAKTMFAKNMRVKVKDSWFKVVENGVYKGRSRGAGYTLAVVKMVRKSDKQPYIMKVYRAIEGPTDTLRKKGDRHKMKHRFNYYRNLRWVTRSVNKYYEDHYRGAEPDGDPAYLHFETLADEAVKMEAPLYFEDLTKKKRARRADERDVIPLSDDKDGAEMMGLLVRSSCPDGIVKPMKDIRLEERQTLWNEPPPSGPEEWKLEEPQREQERQKKIAEVKNDVSLWKHVQSFKALHIIHMDFHWENVCVCQDPKTKKTKHTFIVDYKRIYSWKSDKPEQLKRQPEEHLKKHKPEEDQVVTIKMCLNFMVSWFQNDKKNLAQEIGLNENDYCIWEKMKDYMERFAWNSWLKYANAGDPTEVSTFDD